MFDLVILGGGPAGMMAALRGQELGATVALIERSRLGGTALTDGVVATRVLARAASMKRESRRFQDYGLQLESDVAVDYPQLRRRILQVTDAMYQKKTERLEQLSRNLTLYTEGGDATFVDANTLRLENGDRVQGRKIIICAGGKPRQITFDGHEHARTHRDLLQMDTVPASMVIVGAGATGCQLASVFSAFGSDVTLLESAPHILASEDETVSLAMAEAFGRSGINIITHVNSLQRIEKTGDQATLFYQVDNEDARITADVVVLAVGWPGNAAGLGLDQIGVRTIGGNFIETNDYLQTTAPHIFAAGDITGRMLLVHSASYQGVVAAENALRSDSMRPAEYRMVPRGTFTEPEYAGVGLTSAQAREHGDAVVATVPYTDLDRAIIDERTTGFCKLIAERETGHVIGAHVVGDNAREIVSMIAASMVGTLHVSGLTELERAYPAYNAIVGMAARQIMRELNLEEPDQDWHVLHNIYQQIEE